MSSSMTVTGVVPARTPGTPTAPPSEGADAPPTPSRRVPECPGLALQSACILLLTQAVASVVIAQQGVALNSAVVRAVLAPAPTEASTSLRNALAVLPLLAALALLGSRNYGRPWHRPAAAALGLAVLGAALWVPVDGQFDGVRPWILVIPALVAGAALAFAASGRAVLKPSWRKKVVQAGVVALVVVPASAWLGLRLRSGVGPVDWSQVERRPFLVPAGWAAGSAYVLLAVGGVLVLPPWKSSRARLVLGTALAAAGLLAYQGGPAAVQEALHSEPVAQGSAADNEAGDGSGTTAAHGSVIPGSVVIRSGPGHGFLKLDGIGIGMTVQILCTAYGTPEGHDSTRLWNWTGGGFIADAFLATGSNGALAPGCGGSARAPEITSDAADPSTGPFVLALDTTALNPDGRLNRMGRNTFVVLACDAGAVPGVGSAWRLSSGLHVSKRAVADYGGGAGLAAC